MPSFSVIGNANVDLIALVDELPGLDEARESKEWGLYPGGSGANVASVARSLGATVYLYCAMGTGFFSRALEDELRSKGIVLRPVRKEGEQSIIFIASTPKGRSMISLKGVSHKLLPEELPEVLDGELVHVASKGPAFAERYVDKLPVSYSPGPAAFEEPERVRKLIPHLDFLFVNSAEAKALGLSHNYDTLPKRALVITLGEKGSKVCTRDGCFKVSAYEVEEVVDTTGAGDAYAGTFITTYLETHDLVESARRASVAGALAVTVRGATITLDREVVIKESSKVEVTWE